MVAFLEHMVEMEEENIVVQQKEYVMALHVKTKKCRFVGPNYIKTQRIRCHWVRKNGHSKQNKCCTFQKSCVVRKGKSKVCKNRKLNCHFRGRIIRTKRITHCHIRKYGRSATRQRCCSWNNSCKHKKM